MKPNFYQELGTEVPKKKKKIITQIKYSTVPILIQCGTLTAQTLTNYKGPELGPLLYCV